jgi:UDP-N-acetylglucosamine--dolichyl-phosphate N-acetylglucosaminephosphotransferase
MINLPTSSQFVLLFFGIFLITWLIIPFWIKRAKKAGLVGKDIHKREEKVIAEMGGITVLLGFIIGIMVYIAMRIFIFKANTNITTILAILTAILLAGIIGIIDDVLGWKIGLKQWQKPLLTLLVAMPVMALNAGTRVMSLPFIGPFDLGLIYPLIVIPAIILVGTNGFNMLAGYNGLEAGQGIIILSTLAYFSYVNGSPGLTIVALLMVSALIAFWFYNRYPAKIFPGDTLTYTVGALAAIIAIFANLEKLFLILFIPYIIEFFLKLRGKFKKESFAKIKDDNTLVPKYEKIYGLEHVMVNLLNKLKLNVKLFILFILYK